MCEVWKENTTCLGMPTEEVWEQTLPDQQTTLLVSLGQTMVDHGPVWNNNRSWTSVNNAPYRSITYSAVQWGDGLTVTAVTPQDGSNTLCELNCFLPGDGAPDSRGVWCIKMCIWDVCVCLYVWEYVFNPIYDHIGALNSSSFISTVLKIEKTEVYISL